MKMNYKLIFLIIWMIIIFLFSNNNGLKSSKKSDKLIEHTVVKIYRNFNNKTDKKKIISKYTFIVRKLAHFTLYFILGILSYLYLKDYNINFIYISILFCFLFSLSDEIHQLFISGRSFKLLDIFIDTTSSIMSIFLINLLSKKL